MSDDRFRFDAELAARACAFFPAFCRFTKGEWAGKPFELQPWQADIVRQLFGWRRLDGTRRYRKVYIEVAKKNGKTEFAAALALLLLLGDGELGGEGFALASSGDQAKIVFNAAAAMVDYSSELSARLEPLRTAIYCPQLNAAFKPLSGRPRGKHGFNPSFLIGDEVHEWEDDELYVFVATGMAARRQPLEVLITTAGKQRGFGWEEHQRAVKLRDGVIEDPETLVVIHAADPDDDWTDPDVWAKANPNLDVSVKRAYLEKRCREAEESPRKTNDFLTYHCNIWTGQGVRWLPMGKWDACAGDRDWRELEAELAGRECYGGIDLASTTDICSEVLVFPPLAEVDPWKVLCRFWVPEDTIERRVKQDGQPYDVWNRDGAIFTTPGNVTDYAAIREQVFRDAEVFRILEMAIDRWNATQLAVELRQEGIEVISFGQGFASMSAPAKELERLVLGAQLDHGGHPVLRWMASNVAVETDAAENIKPSKKYSTERIDGIVSLTMGIGLANAAEDEESNDLELYGIEVV